MSLIHVDAFDHLVLTVADISRTVDFYTKVLGMRDEIYGENRHALHFGNVKVNLHAKNHIFLPAAKVPTPGSADLCLRTSQPIQEVIDALKSCDITLEEGPVLRHGAIGAVTSVYIRDPDGNLIEIATMHNGNAD